MSVCENSVPDFEPSAGSYPGFNFDGLVNDLLARRRSRSPAPSPTPGRLPGAAATERLDDPVRLAKGFVAWFEREFRKSKLYYAVGDAGETGGTGDLEWQRFQGEEYDGVFDGEWETLQDAYVESLVMRHILRESEQSGTKQLPVSRALLAEVLAVLKGVCVLQ